MSIRALALAIIPVLPFSASAEENPPLERIAFGSCAKESFNQPIWDAVNAEKPSLFLFLGDNIYGDSDDMKVMRAKYDLLEAKPGYAELKKSCRVLGTWDDHDYGRNDAGVEFEHKAASQQLLLDFFDEPEDSPRRKQEGVYGAWTFGPEGRRVQVLLLDTRYHRSPIIKATKEERPKNSKYFGPYKENTEEGATVLGEAQWAWLEEQLQEPADVRLVGTSIQLIPNGHQWEKWGNFPAERARFFELVRKTKANGVVLLSGDRHLSEICRIPAQDEDEGVGYPLFEATSSGLTQAGGGSKNEPGEHRIHGIFQSRNFGLATIDWEKRELALEIRNEEGEEVYKEEIKLDGLR